MSVFVANTTAIGTGTLRLLDEAHRLLCAAGYFQNGNIQVRSIFTDETMNFGPLTTENTETPSKLLALQEPL